MFGRGAEYKRQGQIDSLIGAGTHVDGSIRFAGGLRIDGEVRGDISASDGSNVSVLVLSERGRVEGGVRVANLILNGTIVGNVTVTESLEMQPKARIIGDIEYAVIEMHQGAVIDGRLVHSEKSVELKLAASN